LRLAILAQTHEPDSLPRQAQSEPASQGELEGLFGHLGETLDAIDFHKGRAPEIVMQRLRRIFLRAALDPREVRILRGILSDAQRMARLAGRSDAAANQPDQS
jgi:tRNA (cytidine32/uridine32-2'-O)-methyltransferase